MYADEIVKMADIKLCIMLSTHPKVSALGSLFNRVVDLIKTTWNATEVEKWAKALDDAVTNLRYRNNMSALTCPRDKWSDRTTDGKLKPPILNSIVAIRFLLEQHKFILREDIWKSYSVITNQDRSPQERNCP